MKVFTYKRMPVRARSLACFDEIIDRLVDLGRTTATELGEGDQTLEGVLLSYTAERRVSLSRRVLCHGTVDDGISVAEDSWGSRSSERGSKECLLKMSQPKHVNASRVLYL